MNTRVCWMLELQVREGRDEEFRALMAEMAVAGRLGAEVVLACVPVSQEVDLPDLADDRLLFAAVSYTHLTLPTSDLV